MSQSPQQAIEQLIATTIQQNGIPAMAAAIVHGNGVVKAYTAQGVRRKDKDPSSPLNQVQGTDMFCVGSVSKPISGFLFGLKVKQNVLAWDTTIGEVFPELTVPGCQAKYAIYPQLVDITLSQLMSWTSGMFDEYDSAHTGQHRGDPPNAPDPWFQQNPGTLLNEWTNPPALFYKRFLYTILSMQQMPIFPAGQGTGYGGAAIICAAMLERRTGYLFEQLATADLFLASAMNNSTFGPTSTSAPSDDPDGVFKHNSAGVPLETGPQNNWNSHAPDGTAALSANDMATFIEQNLPACIGTSPRQFTEPEREVMQTIFNGQPTAGQTRSGWAVHVTGGDRMLTHNGDDGGSYAEVRVHPDRGYGVFAAASINSSISQKPVQTVLKTLESWEPRWELMFGAAKSSNSPLAPHPPAPGHN